MTTENKAPPVEPPARIRTDASNAFAHHTMCERVPKMIDAVLARNGALTEPMRERLLQLRAAIRANHALPAVDARLPGADVWQHALAEREGHSWLNTDWFFAEHYLYRQMVDITDYWLTGHDLFAPHKRVEYDTPGHHASVRRALASAISDSPLQRLLADSVFANRSDLSHAQAHGQGTELARELLLDDRVQGVERLSSSVGPVHLVLDNAGTELNVDLVLVDAMLSICQAPVVLHMKRHPAFVSDVIAPDVHWLVGTQLPSSADERWNAYGPEGTACLTRLRAAFRQQRLRMLVDEFWNGPAALHELPERLKVSFSGARLVIFKGDAHYRRIVNDAIWPPEVPLAAVTGTFPAPLLTLRTLKSDPILGLSAAAMAQLDDVDPSWRTNGRRGVISLGGTV